MMLARHTLRAAQLVVFLALNVVCFADKNTFRATQASLEPIRNALHENALDS